jgi:phenylalanyl-tRNA synthetase beta chain
VKISPLWLREFVDVKVPLRQLADELTHTGTAVESVSGEGDNAAFEMEITTNRVDCMNHYGVAREISATFNTDLKPLVTKLPAGKSQTKFPIEIAEPALCRRYTARIIRNVKMGPAPAHIRKRLEMVEASSINSAVDASNYTLIEMGHPTHAFDLDLLEGKIVVRKAKNGETLKTLDGVDRKLTNDDLVIADAQKPVALAGIMGGFDTMITDKTKKILIESAWFDPVSVRRTARRLGMHTDASHRFERGADYEATSIACARVAQLILETGGELAGEEIDAIGKKLERPCIPLSRSELLRTLGQEIPAREVERILVRLGFKLTPDRASAERRNDYIVCLPSWRLDVEREIDLIEEVARLFGYNNFKNSLPSFSGAVVELPSSDKDTQIRSTLLALGYDEAISPTFISHGDAAKFSSVKPVDLENPLSEEAAVMRTSLVPGMLTMLAHNLNRGTADVCLFESGNVFAQPRTEQKQLCLGATGNAVQANVHEPARKYSFFDLKGAVEELLSAFEHKSMYFDEHVGADYYHPGRSAGAVLDGATVARLGQLHPEIAVARKLKQDIFIAEILLERLYQHQLRRPRYLALSRYPAVERDFSFVFPNGITFDEIQNAVFSLKLAELRKFSAADMLTGKAAERAGIAAGKHSLLLRAQFQSHERTLRDDEVAAWSHQIVTALEKLGGSLRAS